MPSPASTTPPPVTTAENPCTREGVSLTAGPVEAALGHRASVVTMVNCGTKSLRVEGYPAVVLLDAARKPMTITIEHGVSYMARDPGPAPHTLEPGQHLLSVLSWSSTVTDGDSAAGSFVTVTPVPGGEARTLPVDTDLGTTGKLTVTAWAPKLLN
ncbi:DUF4232 domain-containing protein [Amycolatopsis minnesotensis]|uniref:DUF4232 domain-containing protein n=1 Tax=Amycolatopsis minnesotensis TaxID=337894 RepID=A0ABN2RNG9_9PSEU